MQNSILTPSKNISGRIIKSLLRKLTMAPGV